MVVELSRCAYLNDEMSHYHCTQDQGLLLFWYCVLLSPVLLLIKDRKLKEYSKAQYFRQDGLQLISELDDEGLF